MSLGGWVPGRGWLSVGWGTCPCQVGAEPENSPVNECGVKREKEEEWRERSRTVIILPFWAFTLWFPLGSLAVCEV